MAQTAEQIIAELEGFYKPQKEIIAKQQAELPAYYQAQEQGLNVARDNAFRDILGGASARGIAYSGMPIQEQTRYTGERYLPAVAGLKQQRSERETGLQGTLAEIAARQAQQAYGIRESQLQREEAQRQAELDRQMKERQFQAEQAAKRKTGGGKSGSSKQKLPSISDYVSLINSLRSTGQIGDSGYGAIAEYLRQQGEDIARGSVADRALRKAYGFG